MAIELLVLWRPWADSRSPLGSQGPAVKRCQPPRPRTLRMLRTEEAILRPLWRAKIKQINRYSNRGVRGKNFFCKRSHYIYENKASQDKMPDEKQVFLYNCRTFLYNEHAFCSQKHEFRSKMRVFLCKFRTFLFNQHEFCRKKGAI